MSTPVVMPQMGESIAEGTIVRWIKKVGEPVERDEPLFEISTDKVDAEIPSPVAGVLTEIRVKEGETVPVNSIVAIVGRAEEMPSETSQPAPSHEPHPRPKTAPPEPRVDQGPPAGAAPPASSESGRQRSSPLVQRIAKEHHVDISRIAGSGVGGRVTKSDIHAFLDRQPAARPAVPAAHAGDRIEHLSVMRKKIAEHMIVSQRTSAHVHSVFHVDFSAIEELRRHKKLDYEGAGTRLTYMTFIAAAVADVLRRHPVVNSSLDGENIVYWKDINIGIAVALETGLIVPVIRNVDRLGLMDLSRAIADLAERARAKKLGPDEVHGGTFTITNPGQFGSQFGLPIINQPQVAILGVGTIEKRPVVVNDAVSIRTMAYLTLGFDHRLIDGAVADQFMADVKQVLETFDAGRV